MAVDSFLIYLSVIFIASIVPGPSMLLALTHGIKYGAVRSISTALGNVTASIIQASVSVAGLGAALYASEYLFYTIKISGAIYLIYIGVMTWRAPAQAGSEDFIDDIYITATPLKLYTQGFMVAAGNPKAIVFFTALFPQFINPETTSVFQMTICGISLCVIAFLCMMIYAVFGHVIISFINNSGRRKAVNRVLGSTLIGAGVGLTISD